MIDEHMLSRVIIGALSAISASDLFLKEDESEKEGIVNTKRSSEFIEQLRISFLPYFSAEDQHVLTKTKKAAFTNRSEFLFDLVIVKTQSTHSPFSGRKVNVITDCLLQIESEFALDFNEAMIDFSKLLCGLSPVKVMIMPFFKKDQTINDWLQHNIFTNERRQKDKALYYLVYIKHPKLWMPNDVSYFEIYKCADQEITKIDTSNVRV